MEKKFLATFSQFLTKQDTLILALSGGPDSVFLGEMLSQIGCKQVIVAHFNHQLRAEESDRDAIFCQKIAKKWNFEFVTENWQTPISSEEKARDARYNFLTKLADQKNAKVILLAHHQDDNVETIFFNFLRGTGVKGLAGMKIFDNERKILRLLLDFSKKEILDYLKKHKLSYCLDSTNKNVDFSRNFLRNKIFPLLRQEFSHFENSIMRSAKIFNELDQYIASEAENWVQENQGVAHGFNKKIFLSLLQTLKTEIIRKAFLKKNLDFEQIEQILAFIENSNSGKHMQIKTKKIKVYKENFFIE